MHVCVALDTVYSGDLEQFFCLFDDGDTDVSDKGGSVSNLALSLVDRHVSEQPLKSGPLGVPALSGLSHLVFTMVSKPRASATLQLRFDSSSSHR